MKGNPLVTICCTTYNHVGFIRQALEGLLMQRTDFEYEIIVHDDASTDGTADIVKEYASRFPDRVKPILQKENKYSKEGLNLQFRYIFPRAKGKYIAFCEGDDYWIDPLKLQKQVGFLEDHEDFGLVHTRAVKFSQRYNRFEACVGFESSDFETLITENTLSNLTVCLRNDLLKRYVHEVKPMDHPTWSTVDFPIWLWLIQHAKFKFIPDITGVYRVIDLSISHHEDHTRRLDFYKGVYDIVRYFLEGYDVAFSNKVKARYAFYMISMYFLVRDRKGIHDTIPVFYRANDWLDLIWIFITLPFYFSPFLVKSSFYIRNLLFRVLRIYPHRKDE